MDCRCPRWHLTLTGIASICLCIRREPLDPVQAIRWTQLAVHSPVLSFEPDIAQRHTVQKAQSIHFMHDDQRHYEILTAKMHPVPIHQSRILHQKLA